MLKSFGDKENIDSRSFLTSDGLSLGFFKQGPRFKCVQKTTIGQSGVDEMGEEREKVWRKRLKNVMRDKLKRTGCGAVGDYQGPYCE